jgi:hypothetical protein
MRALGHDCYSRDLPTVTSENPSHLKDPPARIAVTQDVEREAKRSEETFIANQPDGFQKRHRGRFHRPHHEILAFK